MKIAKTWNGMELHHRINRAAGRAIVAIGVNVAIETKRVTHVDMGTLRRSVHCAPKDHDHGGDESAAERSDLLLSVENLSASDSEMGPCVEVGSWLPYASSEWVSRNHPGIQQGLEAVRGARLDAIVAQAFVEEGLGYSGSGRKG